MGTIWYGLGSKLKSSAKLLHTPNHWAPTLVPYNVILLHLSNDLPQASLEYVCRIQISLMNSRQEKNWRVGSHWGQYFFAGFGGSLVSLFNETLTKQEGSLERISLTCLCSAHVYLLMPSKSFHNLQEVYLVFMSVVSFVAMKRNV